MRTVRPTILLLAATLAACGPDYNAVANRLRQENLDKDKEIGALKQQLANRDATIRDQQTQLADKSPPLPTLPPDRLAQLFTAARIEIRNNTDTNDPDGKGLSGFRVFVRAYTDDNQIVPATGTLTIEAFELPPTPAEPKRLGTWTFDAAQMKANWYTALSANYFAFNCPWAATPPTQPGITFKARFQDTLTGKTLEAELNKKVTLK